MENKLIYLEENQEALIQGSGKRPYVIKKTSGIVYCNCPAWLHQNLPTQRRVCKHIKKNIDPSCWSQEAKEEAGVSLNSSAVASEIVTAIVSNDNAQEEPIRYTKTGKISTAVKGGAVVKDTAPPVLLANKWDGVSDVSGWWKSFKLDGCRSWWNGEEFLSRLGNTFHVPQWFKNQMPRGVVLDGELFAGNGKFLEAVSTVKKLVPIDSEWENIKYVVFDMPEHGRVFEERVEAIKNIINLAAQNNDNVSVLETLEFVQVSSNEDALNKLKEAEDLGYEGIMLRAPNSLYEEGRSNTLLKVKSFHDEEATVVEYIQGRGKHKGRMGALVVQLDNGVKFQLGSGFSDRERENPPSAGSKITYRYQEKSKTGVPRFPTFISARNYE